MSRGVDGRDIFRDDIDRRRFIRILIETKEEFGCRIFAYCLMTNHFHVVVRVADIPLYRVMHRFLTLYGRSFNSRHHRQGHLFQSRYTAKPCRQDPYLAVLLRYVHDNPVRAKLADHASGWPWSGHSGLSGMRADPLLDIAEAAEVLGTTIPRLPIVYLGILAGSPRELVPHPETTPREERPSLTDLAASVASEYGLTVDDLVEGTRGKRVTLAKIALARTARDRGFQLKDVAARLGCSAPALSLLLSRNVNSVPDPFVN
jgi:REP element-mobilizing transposase RayT